MDKSKVLKSIKSLREKAKKRNFSQRVDLIINLKNIDIKKTEQQQEFFVTMHHSSGRDIKVCALVGGELKDEAEKSCSKVILAGDFPSYSDPKKAKKLAEEHNFFIAQANVMPKVASAFGRVLGPRGKMPNPKAGCVVPPKAALKPLVEKLGKTVKISIKKEPVVKCSIGNEKSSDEDLADNIVYVFNQVVSHLPGEKNNIREVMIKFTMSAPIALEWS
jgi:large subunit ribosomal protein L1